MPDDEKRTSIQTLGDADIDILPDQDPQGVEKARLEKALDFQTRMARITRELLGARSFFLALPEVEADLLHLLHAERLTVYQRLRACHEIVSRHRTGADTQEIRVSLSLSSIAGYVALTQEALRIADVRDESALRAIHPRLRFDDSFDRISGFRTRSVIGVPILTDGVLLGVLQVLNRTGGGTFSEVDFENATQLADLVGRKFRHEFGGTRSPYEHLVRQRKLTQAQVDEACARAAAEKRSVSQVLVDDFKLQPAEVGASLEYYYQVPWFGFDAHHELPAHLLKGLAKGYLRRQLWVPVEGGRSQVTILIDNPTDQRRIAEIHSLLKVDNFVFKVGFPEDILRYLGYEIKQAAPETDVAVADLVERLQIEEGLEVEEVAAEPEAEDEVVTNEPTIIKFVNQLVIEAWRQGASDIHLEPTKGNQPMQVRFRVDGQCRHAFRVPAIHAPAVVARVKVLARLDISERRLPQDGKMVLRYKGRTLELRVATLPTVNGEAAVLRLLAASEPLPLDRLNFSPRNLDGLLQAVSHPHGIFLVVGPTGSGKTTTLHGVLGHLNQPDVKIWTAEDPVEISQNGLMQVQMNAKIKLNFATALRAFLRADPDIIMIGEMRDQETAQAGVEASLTGHLVLSTLHTNSAPETLVRLLDLGIDPVSFADAFLGVMAQRLVRTLCKECKEPYPASSVEVDQIRHYYGLEHADDLQIDPAKVILHRTKGCQSCGGTGYRGRTGIHELLLNTPEVRALIYRRATATEVREIGMKLGMRTLLQDGLQKVVMGQTDLKQVIQAASAS